MGSAPQLERHCSSWVIVDRATGAAVMETFDQELAEAVHPDKYEVLTALQWLCRFNASVSQAI